MDKIRLGETGLMVTRCAFGALPVQRVPMAEAVRLLRAAYDGGINYFDTANAYTDSEEKIGAALSDVREKIIISTKTMAADEKTATEHIETSLRRMKTDYIDILQIHNIPSIKEREGAIKAAFRAKEKGYVRHVGVTAHKHTAATEALDTGLFETLQFPFSYLADEKETALVRRCEKEDVGFIAMKAIAGGLLTNARACRAFFSQYPNAVPIWGIQRMEELREWLALEADPPALTDELRAVIEADRRTLAGAFCRGCGYCMPCPEGIDIKNAARMNMLLRRSPWRQYYAPEQRELMERIRNCRECGLCRSRCPYGLDTPNVLKFMLEDYERFYEQHKGEEEE